MHHRAFIECFRQAGPYINAHRGRTAVIAFGGETVEHERFPALVHDIGLLHSLGLRLVLVHGARPQIEARLAANGIEPRMVDDLRITDEVTLPWVKDAIGSVRIRIEALLSMGLANSPLHGARIRVASGNVVTARPLGVRDGIDFCFTGEVRRIDHGAVRQWLDDGAVVLLSSLGYSPTGEVFNLSADDVAIATAGALEADKLIVLGEAAGPIRHGGEIVHQLNPSEAERLLDSGSGPGACAARHLRHAVTACRRGVRRVHLVDHGIEGGLLLELFTRDGVGTMVTAEIYEALRPATIDDIGGMLEIIEPMEAEGVLVRRSRELLETEIDRFTVLERDGTVIGCAALYPFADESVGELACVVVHPEYRNGGRADVLLRHIEGRARRQGLSRLVVLTTRTAHWFMERGFVAASPGDLPVAKRELYNYQRRSKVFMKAL